MPLGWHPIFLQTKPLV